MIAWVDIETTAIDPAEGELLEVAIILTDEELVEIARREVLVYPKAGRGTEAALAMHRESGLLDEAQDGNLLEVAEGLLCQFLRRQRAEGAPMAGSSVHFDRRWLQVYMPQLEALFDYHNIDVSSLRFLCVEWGWTPAWTPDEDKPHRAMPDLERSIAELTFYREHIERRITLGREELLARVEELEREVGPFAPEYLRTMTERALTAEELLAQARAREEELRAALEDWEETVHYAVGFIEWVRNTDEPEMKALLDGYAEPETGLTFDEWAEMAENGLSRIRAELREALASSSPAPGGRGRERR